MNGLVILAIVFAIIVVAGSAVLIMRSGRLRTGAGSGSRERDLRRSFGPEYDRLAEKHGNRKAVEEELTRRIQDHAALTLRPLERDEHERYVRTWRTMQERFVDDPRGAAQQADQMISGLLTAIGYPSEDFDRQLDLASVDHAYALSSYRRGRELVQQATNTEPKSSAPASPNGSGASNGPRAAKGATAASTSPDGSTELLRQALLQYRTFFNGLLGRASSDRVPATAR